MNKMLLVMLLVLIAGVVLLAMLALGYPRIWGLSGEATSTPTSEFPTFGGLDATATPAPVLTPTLPPLRPGPTKTPDPCGDFRPCPPAPTPTLWIWHMATPTH